MWLHLFAILGVLQLGYILGKWSISKQCRDHGRFVFNNTEYECIYIKEDISSSGLPDALRDDAEEDPPFGNGVLDKIKSLDQSKIDNGSSVGDKPKENILDKRVFFGTGKQYCCVKCCRDAKDIQSYMIVCPDCGDKRCSKALNHTLVCNKSHLVDGNTSSL